MAEVYTAEEIGYTPPNKVFSAEEIGYSPKSVFSAEEIGYTPPLQIKEDEASFIDKVGREAQAMSNVVVSSAQFIGSEGATLIGGALDYLTDFVDTTVSKTQLAQKIQENPDSVSLEDLKAVNTKLNSLSLNKSYKEARDTVTPAAEWLHPEKFLMIEGMADQLGVKNEYLAWKEKQGIELGKTKTYEILDTIGKGVEWLGEKGEEKFGIPKDLTTSATNLAMLKVRVPKVVSERFGPSESSIKLNQERSRKILGYDQKTKDVKYAPTKKENVETLLNNWLPENNLDLIRSTRKITEEGQFKEGMEMLAQGKEKRDTTFVVKVSKGIHEELGINFKTNPDRFNRTMREIRDYMEWEPGVPFKRPKLNADQQRIVDKYLQPMQNAINKETARANRRGLLEAKVNLDQSLTGKFVSRKSPNAKKTIGEMLFGDRFQISQPYAIDRLPGSAQSRNFFVYEEGGRRTLVSFGSDSAGNPVINRHSRSVNRETGELVKAGVLDKELTKAFRENPEILAGDTIAKGRLKNATSKEIEYNTYTRNATDIPTVLGTSLTNLRKLNTEADFSHNILRSPYMKENALRVKKDTIVPPEYVAANVQLPKSKRQLNDYYYKENTAWIIEDFNRPVEKTIFSKVSNALVKNMMLNSFPHMHNEAIHWFLSRGAMRTFDPRSIASFKRDMADAFNDVVNKTPFYREMLNSNSSMLGTHVSNRTFIDAALEAGRRELKSARGFKELAKATGRKPAELYSGISDMSNLSMWQVRDVLFVQLIKEKMRKDNISMKEAISRVEKHMPTYRLPTQVGKKILGSKGSRMLSKFLQNPNLVIFARYKHGMISSALNTVKDLALSKDVRGSKTKMKQFRDGVDSALAFIIAGNIIYPLMDDLFSFIFGSEDAKMRRAGPMHVIDTAMDVGAGKKDPYALLSNLITINPTVQSLVELMINYQFYNKQSIVNLDDPLPVMLSDYGDWIMNRVPQASAVNISASTDYKFLARQLDVKIKSKKTKEAEERNNLTRESKRLDREYNRYYNITDD